MRVFSALAAGAPVAELVNCPSARGARPKERRQATATVDAMARARFAGLNAR